MITFRRSLAMISTTLLLSIFLVACGATQAATTTNSTNTQTTPTMQNTATPKATMGTQMTPKATSTTMGTNGNQQTLIHTAMVTLNGKKVQVLSNQKGFLLYYYTKDAKLSSNCTGACAQNWPPVLAPQSSMSVHSSTMLPHKLTVQKTTNGNQVFYDGHALYTYAGDKKAGQFNGRGAGMAWYLVSVTL